MVEGEGRIVPSGMVSVLLPEAVAKALDVSAGDEVDVDFFETPEEFADTYGDMSFIAITRK